MAQIIEAIRSRMHVAGMTEKRRYAASLFASALLLFPLGGSKNPTDLLAHFWRKNLVRIRVDRVCDLGGRKSMVVVGQSTFDRKKSPWAEDLVEARGALE